jgi:hypothetical protein
MDKVIIDAWDRYNHKLKDYFKKTRQDEYNSYLALLTKTIEIIFPEYVDENRDYRLDHTRITEIDYGQYQGTLMFVIANDNYQPNPGDHWYTSVDYGSCSGCDTLQRISTYDDDLPTEEQIEGYWTVCLHMIQKLKRMEEGL